MKHTNILKDFLRYVSLNILGQMAYSCYTMADTFFVSAKLGSVGLTALNLAFPIFCLMNGIGLMIGIGAGTRYSLAKSRGEKELGNKIFTNAFYMVVAFASLFFLAGILFSGTLVRLLGADDSMFALTNTYLQVMLLFAPAFFLNNLLQCFVRNDGCPGLSMAAMISGSLSNVILDYVFFFRWIWGFLVPSLPPDWLRSSAFWFCPLIFSGEKTTSISEVWHRTDETSWISAPAESRPLLRKRPLVSSCFYLISFCSVWREI